jgi:predicted dienelactone hydrolase
MGAKAPVAVTLPRPRRTLIALVALLALAGVGLVVATRVSRRADARRTITRVLGPARRLSARKGEPAIWTLQALVHGDQADLYLPKHGQGDGGLPVALVLQGANVDRRHYGAFASALAGEGFLVVVPDHWRIFPPLPLLGQRLLLADQRQIGSTMAALRTLNRTGPAPLRGAIDGERLVVIGHSMGGLAGLEALADRCRFPLCIGTYHRPTALRGGVFYGTDLLGHGGGPVGPIEMGDLPVAMISGSRDGASPPADVEATWEQIRSRHKALLTITGANHYAITDTSRPVNPASLPAIHPDPNPAIGDQAARIAAIARWSGLFLKGEVLGDPSSLQQWRRWVRERQGHAGVGVRVEP